MDKPDIAEIIVNLDKCLNELKKYARDMNNPAIEEIVKVTFEMRWDLAQILTIVGKSE